jgi:hypothetical protein
VNNFTPQGEQADTEYLVRKGVLKRPVINVTVPPFIIPLMQSAAANGISLSGDAANVLKKIAETHVEIFKTLEQREPGVWTFATIGEGLDIPSDESVVRRAIVFEMHSGLPVPADGVPYEDILEFRHRRSDELSNLRGRMDETYLAISRSGDIPKAKSVEMTKLEAELARMRDAMTASRFRFSFESVQVELSLPLVTDAMLRAAGAGLVGQYYGIPSVITLPLVAAASLFKFQFKLTASPIDREGPLKYIYLADKEGIANSASISADEKPQPSRERTDRTVDPTTSAATGQGPLPPRSEEMPLPAGKSLADNLAIVNLYDQGFVTKLTNGSVVQFKPIADALLVNHAKMISLYRFPFDAAAWSFVTGLCNAQMRVDLGVQILVEPPFETDTVQLKKRQEALGAAFKTWAEAPSRKGIGLDQFIKSSGLTLVEACFRISQTLQKPPRSIETGYQVLLSSVLVIAWTAFEAFARDLWIEAVNRAPDPLANNVVNSRPRRRDQERSISYRKLAAAHFDLSKTMGIHLERANRVTFLHFTGLKNAYVSAFKEPARELFARYPALHEMAELRHLFVHTNGAVDSKFLSKVSSAPALKGLAVGEQVPLTGKMVRDYVDQSLRCAGEIFELVDREVAAYLAA